MPRKEEHNHVENLWRDDVKTTSIGKIWANLRRMQSIKGPPLISELGRELTRRAEANILRHVSKVTGLALREGLAKDADLDPVIDRYLMHEDLNPYAGSLTGWSESDSSEVVGEGDIKTPQFIWLIRALKIYNPLDGLPLNETALFEPLTNLTILSISREMREKEIWQNSVIDPKKACTRISDNAFFGFAPIPDRSGVYSRFGFSVDNKSQCVYLHNFHLFASKAAWSEFIKTFVRATAQRNSR